MKKLLALMLTLALVLGLAAPVLADEAQGWYEVDGDSADSILGGVHLIDLDEDDEWAMPAGESALRFGIDVPTLRLVVNGVPSEVELVVDNCTTYAHASDLRALLGAQAAAPTVDELIPVRQAAQAAGWEVQWYDGGWTGIDQQVCLWSKDAFLAAEAPKYTAFRQFLQTLSGLSMDLINTPTPKTQLEIVNLNLTRFDTLDGERYYTARVRVETTMQKGVMDCVLTFDLGDLLKLFTAQERAALAEKLELQPASLTQLFTAGKVELVVDLNQGAIAYNAPVLALLDPELAGWQVTYLPDFEETMAAVKDPDLLTPLFDQMVASAQWQGGVGARESLDQTLKLMKLFLSNDCFQLGANGWVSYVLTTDRMNAALAYLVGDGAEGISFFKKCEVSYSIDPAGAVTLSANVRPDVSGIAQAAALSGEGADAALEAAALRVVLECLDMELTGAGSGSLYDKTTEKIKLHWNNQGVLELTGETGLSSSTKSPRSIAQLERSAVTQPKAGLSLAALIGG